MKKVTLRAHFDGQQIRIDEPFELEPDTPLTIIVESSQEQDTESQDWSILSASSLATAYGENEPEYSLDLIKEPNPDSSTP
jgi:hypothetical protein